MSQMLCKVSINPFLIALITVDICSSFRCDGAELDGYGMRSGVSVGKTVTVTANTTELSSTTSKVTTL